MADHFAEIPNMVGIGSGAQREVEDWAFPLTKAPRGSLAARFDKRDLETEKILARRLARFGIIPRIHRFGSRHMRGYKLSDFAAAFARSLP